MTEEKKDKPESKLTRYVKFRSSFTQATIIPYLFIAYPLAGIIIGWWLDKWLKTTPWLLLVFFIGGMIEAFREMMRIAKRVERQMEEEDKKKESDFD